MFHAVSLANVIDFQYRTGFKKPELTRRRSTIAGACEPRNVYFLRPSAAEHIRGGRNNKTTRLHLILCPPSLVLSLPVATSSSPASIRVTPSQVVQLRFMLCASHASSLLQPSALRPSTSWKLLTTFNSSALRASSVSAVRRIGRAGSW